MAEFSVALALVRSDEGGWVNNPNDGGGETYAGISKHNFPAWPGWEEVDEIRKKTSNISELNKLLDSDERLQTLVANFYHQNFWNYDVVPSQLIANKLFNLDVNMGRGHAVKFLQESLNELGASIAVDGSLGPQTLEAMSKQKEADILTHLRVEASLYYHQIVAAHPDKIIFLKDWLTRAAQ